MAEIENKVREIFNRRFGQPAQFASYAPGRVNIIGEHTDYNDGFVMPCAIRFGTAMAAAPNDLGRLRIFAADIDGGDNDEFVPSADFQPDASKIWVNYLRAIVTILAQRGFKVGGLDVAITGDIPLGAGLSSSASLEVAFGALLSGIGGFGLPGMELAKIGQAAEAMCGMPCGIMDQAISALGTADHLMRLDCRSFEPTQVAVPPTLTIMVINSNCKHQLIGSEYSDRRSQCESAAKIMGVPKLRDATLELLKQHQGELSDVEYRRAHHAITEDDRVLEASKAFEAGDLKALADLMYASHVSMRDEFEICIPETNALVEIVRETLVARGEPGAVRQTGGGFGGSIVAVMKPEAVAEVTAAVNDRYPRIAMRQASIFCTKACDGVRFAKL